MNKYAFFDVDGTLYEGYTANDFIISSVKDDFCDSEMEQRMKKVVESLSNGTLNYHNASQKIMDIMGEIVKDKTEAEVNEKVDKFLEQKGLNKWFEPIYRQLKEKDFKIYLVSGGASFIIKRLAQKIDEDIIALSTEYKLNSDGTYIGEIVEILNGEKKAIKLREIMGEKGLRKNIYSIGFGDSSGDIEMLRETDQGYLYKPSEKLLEFINEEGFKVFNDETEIFIPDIYNLETHELS
jgi:HAD superfamily hydrolase (TIGR01490 family)